MFGTCLALAANLVAVGALIVSIFQFLRRSSADERTKRTLAAASSTLTLLLLVLMYSGEFQRNLLTLISSASNSDAATLSKAQNILNPIEKFLTHVTNSISPGKTATTRPNPSLWPAVLFAVSYGIRGLIYRFVTRKNHEDSGFTGSVYWSHITAYLMLVAFAIEVVGWNPLAVVTLSLLSLGIFVVGVKYAVEDLSVVIISYLKSAGHLARALGKEVARLATEVAAFFRALAERANRLYLEAVRKPVRAHANSLVNKTKKIDDDAGVRLGDQDSNLGHRFKVIDLRDDSDTKADR